MIIRVSNIRDFIAFIHNAIHNGEQFPRVLHASNPTRSPVHFDEPINHVDFTYALFTTKLRVLYAGIAKAEEFERINQELLDYRYKEDHFRIQVFRKIKFDGNILHVEEELDVI